MSPVIVKLEVVKVKLFCLKLSNHSGKNSIECQIYRRSNIPKKNSAFFNRQSRTPYADKVTCDADRQTLTQHLHTTEKNIAATHTCTWYMYLGEGIPVYRGFLLIT